MNIQYQLISASGNPTAIISGKFSFCQKQIINQQIFATNKLVEQIGYIYQNNGRNFFEMMGGEFSGNGCRAAGFFLLNQKPGIITFNSSGTAKKITVNLDSQLWTTVNIPYIYKPKINQGFFLKMFGSYFVVKNGFGNLKMAKQLLLPLQKYNAVGIMFISKISENKYNLIPYFWVKYTNTLVNETACGSGSVASDIFLSINNKTEFIQPSGQSIFVNPDLSISGPTKLLKIYNVKI